MIDSVNIDIKNFRYKKYFEKIFLKLIRVEDLKSNQISIFITGDKIIRKLNKKYRKKDKITDVLSFAERDINNGFFQEKNSYLGEIIINTEEIKRRTEDFKKEIKLLLIHGYLHLIGYNHDNLKQEKIMNKKTNELMEKI